MRIILFFLLMSSNVFSQINVVKYGANGQDNIDDTEAFKRAFNYFQSGGEGTFYIPSGTYLISSPIHEINAPNNNFFLERDFKIECSENVKIISTSSLFSFVASTKVLTTLSIDAIYNQNYILVNNVGISEVGDQVEIVSDENGETGWGYNENDVASISRISGDTLFLSKKINFTYNVASENVNVKIYSPVTASITGGYWESNATILSVSNVTLDINNATFQSSTNKVTDAISGNYTINSSSDNCEFRDWRYGIVLSGGYNANMTNTVANNCFHPFAPSVFFDSFSSTNGVGYFTALDSHSSIRDRYENWKLYEGGVATRGFGVTLRDINIINSEVDSTMVIYNNAITAENEVLRQLPVLLEGVIIESPFSAITIGELSDVKVINSKIGEIRGDLDTKKISVTNSELGRITLRDGNLYVSNCLFNKQLGGGSNYLISKNLGGDVYLDNVRIENYSTQDNLYKFRFGVTDYWNNCDFSQLGNWVDQGDFNNVFQTQYSPVTDPNP